MWLEQSSRPAHFVNQGELGNQYVEGKTYRCFCSVILWICIVWMHGPGTAGGNNVASGYLVLAHEVNGELRAVNNALVDNIGAD